MPRVFVEQALCAGEGLELDAAASRHVQVLRLQAGDALTLFDGRGGQWSAQVARMGRSRVSVDVQAHDARECEAPRTIELAIVMPANERMDSVIEKATELGVGCVVPLQSERSVVRLSGERAIRRVAHWQAIARAACEQCGRNRVPRVADITPLALYQPPQGHTRLLLSPEPTAPALTQWLADAPAPQPLVLACGPEGGFSPDEIRALRASGWQPARLGPRILRADTAALAAVALAALEA